MFSVVMGLVFIVLIAALAVGIGALGQFLLGLIRPLPPRTPEQEWAPRTGVEVFARGGGRTIRALRPDAAVPIATLARDDGGQSPEPNRAGGSGGAEAVGASDRRASASATPRSSCGSAPASHSFGGNGTSISGSTP